MDYKEKMTREEMVEKLTADMDGAKTLTREQLDCMGTFLGRFLKPCRKPRFKSVLSDESRSPDGAYMLSLGGSLKRRRICILEREKRGVHVLFNECALDPSDAPARELSRKLDGNVFRKWFAKLDWDVLDSYMWKLMKARGNLDDLNGFVQDNEVDARSGILSDQVASVDRMQIWRSAAESWRQLSKERFDRLMEAMLRSALGDEDEDEDDSDSGENGDGGDE